MGLPEALCSSAKALGPPLPSQLSSAVQRQGLWEPALIGVPEQGCLHVDTGTCQQSGAQAPVSGHPLSRPTPKSGRDPDHTWREALTRSQLCCDSRESGQWTNTFQSPGWDTAWRAALPCPGRVMLHACLHHSEIQFPPCKKEDSPVPTTYRSP